MEQHVLERTIAGRTLKLETGRIGKLAAGTVIVTYGETVVLGSAVTGPGRPGMDFFPLTADYREKTYAAGKFPGGFFKREARPTQKEILTMRMIDRPIRPLFPERFYDEVMLQTMVLAADQENDPDILAMISASAALSVSSLPFDGPVGACRIGYVDGKYVVNPTFAEMQFSTLELVAAGHRDGLNMIEVGSKELSEDVVAGAIELATQTVKEVVAFIQELADKVGTEKMIPTLPDTSDLKAGMTSKFGSRLREARKIAGKKDRQTALGEIKKEIKATYCPEDADTPPEHGWGIVGDVLDALQGEIVSEMVVKDNLRSDGRGALELRQIEGEVGLLPRVHGSALFQRGETQALCVATLGTGRDEQIVDGLSEEYSKKFMLHYNFPPMCVGEVRRLGATSRREIGHGNLAEKALEWVLPSPDVFPYTIRLVSEIMESNGSSSMASVCSGCLALMDAGVPIRQPVAGISVGMFEHAGEEKLVVDILGEEDHFGLMDFKVAGTQRGITAIQLDLKGRMITQERIIETLQVAKDTRMKILKTMLTVLPAPRKETSPHAPRILTIKINPEKIGKVIGPGGKNIKMLEAETGARVEIEEDGTIRVSSTNMQAAEDAIAMIEAVTAEVKVGRVYNGKVSSVKDFGAFIELTPGQDGLCHISELDTEYVKSAADVVKIGEIVRVKVIAVDDQGRIKLSRKAVMMEEQEEPVS